MRINKKFVFRFQKGKQKELVRKAIEKAGSQRKLSFLLGIPKGCISSYKTERFCIPYERLSEILSFLEITNIEDLIEKKLPKHWGQKLSAKQSISKLSKKELAQRMLYVRSFKKQKIVKINLPINKYICEFYGILMGDGCISKYQDYEKFNRCDMVVTGDKRFEMDYYKYIQNLLKARFNINSYIYQYQSNNSLRLTIRNKPFSNYLIKLGFPVGKKYIDLTIPKKLYDLPWNKLKFLIRGMFDTDGTIFAKKNEGYRYPYIGISTKSDRLRSQLISLLRKRGYPFYDSGNDLFMKGIKNIKSWMNDVGCSNPKHRFKYEYWLQNKKLPARLYMGK